ncbi:hypothetical protein IFM89_024609 [Coptis chinensis]|uniref:Uncharacterized protein n=1 Tax=Coptis chinensis TaxID=261450 RepID=A0A835I7P1_9MAGN|nr:hypothetical protein IFM89_024609 [Coptis chinensis]
MENELPGITDEYGVEKDMADVAEFQECVENEKVDEVEEVLGDPELGMEFGTIDEYMEHFTRYAADLAAENEGKTEMVFRWIKGLLNELKISDEIDEGSHASTPEIRTQKLLFNGTNGMGFLNVPNTPGSSNSQRLDARLNFSNGTNGMGFLNVPGTPSSSNYQGLDTRRSFSNGRNGMGFSNAVSFEWADYYPFLRG